MEDFQIPDRTYSKGGKGKERERDEPEDDKTDQKQPGKHQEKRPKKSLAEEQEKIWQAKHKLLRESSQVLKAKVAAQKAETAEYYELQLENVKAEKRLLGHVNVRLKRKQVFEDDASVKDSYNEKIKENTKRIISLGDDQFRAYVNKEKLRGNWMQSLNVQFPSTHTRGILLLYKHEEYREPRKRLETVMTRMKIDTIERNGLRDSDKPDIRLWDITTNEYRNPKKMIGSHIVAHRLENDLFAMVFGTEMLNYRDGPENCLILPKFIEGYFDRHHLAIVPVDFEEDPITRWRWWLINQEIEDEQYDGKTTFADLHNLEIEFKTSFRPAARFLYYHFVTSVQHAKEERWRGFERTLELTGKGKPFATWGRYLRISFLVELAKDVGDWSDDTERMLIDPDAQFPEEDKRLEEWQQDKLGRMLMDTERERAEEAKAEMEKEGSEEE